MKKHRRGKEQPGLSWKLLKAEWRNWFENKKPVLFFALKFGALIALFYGLLATPFFNRALYAYLEANAWLANGILNALGQHSHLSEITIASPRFSLTVRRGCDAVEPTWLLCAAILAFPANPVRKIYGVLVGICFLQLLNLVRIVTLYGIGVHWPSFFDSAHMEIWPAIFILAAILLFISWKTGIATPHKSHEA